MPGFTVIGVVAASGSLVVAAVVSGRVADVDDDEGQPGARPWSGYVEAPDVAAAKREAARLAAPTVWADAALTPPVTASVTSISDTAWAIAATAMGQVLPDGAARSLAANWAVRVHGVELSRLAVGTPYNPAAVLDEIARARVGADRSGVGELDVLGRWVRGRRDGHG